MRNLVVFTFVFFLISPPIFAQDDGQWTHYSNQDETQYNYITALTTDDTNSLWAATDTGLYHFDGESWIFYSFEEITAEDNIFSMVFDNGKLHLVAGTYATFFNNSWSGRIEGSELVSVLEPNSIDIAPNGDVWIGTSGGGVFQYDGDSWEHYTLDNGLPTESIFSIAVDMSGNVWCGTFGDGLMKFDGMNWTQYTKEDGIGGLQEIIVRNGSDGIVWCSGKGWVAKYNENSWKLVDGCPFTYNSTLYVDTVGQIWISDTYHFASYDGIEWNEYSLSNYEEHIASLAVDSTGIVWIGTWENGIYRFDPNPTIMDETTSLPIQLSINGNYPNPFNSNTLISFYTLEKGYCELGIYSLSGQLVKKLISHNINKGEHYVNWNGIDSNGRTVASGIYFVILSIGSAMDVHKLTFTK